jgi:hypothetical protein
MPAKKARKKPVPPHLASSRTSSKASTSKQSTGKKSGLKRSSLGLLSKATKVTKVVGAVMMGAATGAVTGAVQGAVEAGNQASGSSPEQEKKSGTRRRIGQSRR